LSTTKHQHNTSSVFAKHNQAQADTSSVYSNTLVVQANLTANTAS